MTIEKWNYQDLFRFGFDENNKMIISEQHIDADIRKGLYINLYEYSKHGYNKPISNITQQKMKIHP